MTNKVDSKDKTILGGLLVGGYMLMGFLSFFIKIPAENVNIVLGIMSTLGPVIGVIAMAVWPRGTEADQKTIQNLSEKVPPVTVPVEEITPKELINDQQGKVL